MSSIDKLGLVGTITSADRIPLYSVALGADAAVSIAGVMIYLAANLTPSGSMLPQYAAPNATGFTVKVVPASDGADTFLLLTPAAGYAAGTVALPSANLIDGQRVTVHCTQSVTTLTVSGGTVYGAPTTLTADAFFTLRYDAVMKAWYRI